MIFDYFCEFSGFRILSDFCMFFCVNSVIYAIVVNYVLSEMLCDFCNFHELSDLSGFCDFRDF